MRLAPTAALIALGLTLGACGPVNRGLESVNQPVVDRTDYVLDLPAAGLSSQSSPEASRPRTKKRRGSRLGRSDFGWVEPQGLGCVGCSKEKLIRRFSDAGEARRDLAAGAILAA